MKARTLGLLAALAVVVAIIAPKAREASSAREAGQAAAAQESSRALDDCINRGIGYFQSIGAYPTLKAAPNAGRNAVDVARERCGRTLTAF